MFKIFRKYVKVGINNSQTFEYRWFVLKSCNKFGHVTLTGAVPTLHL